MKNVKKYQGGDLNIPPQNYFKDYFTSYYMIKNKNYFFKDWLNKRKDILDKNIHKFSLQYPDMVDDVLTELQNQLSNVNSVKEYARDNNIDFLPNYTKSPRLEYYIDDFQYLNHSNGLYAPGIHQILYNDVYPNIIIHERTHSLNPRSQEYAIGQLNIKTKNDYSESDYHKSINIDNSYFDNPKEIYARLMQFRYANKLDPNKTYTIEDVKKFKEDPYILDFNLLDRYSEEDVLKLLNEIAYNNTNESINMAKKGCKLIPKRKVKKCQAGEIIDNKQMYTAGYTDPVTVTASKPTEKEWLEYIKNNNITTRSKEYTKLPANIRSLVVQEEIRRKRDKSVLPTVAAITLPTLIPAAAASLVGSGALTAAADAAGTIGTKIVGTNLGKAASAFMANPYVDMGLTALGAYTVPSLYNSGVSNIKQGNYGRALGDFASIGLEGLGFLGTINNIKNVYKPINRMMNGVLTRGIYTESTTPEITQKYVINNTPGYQLKGLMRGNPLEKQLSKNGTISVNSILAYVNKLSDIEKEIINKTLNNKFKDLTTIDYNKFRKAVQDELIVYNRVPNEKYKDYGIDKLGINYADPAGLSVAGWENLTPETYVFESPKIPKGNARHYNDNTLGHSRTYTTTNEPDVLHIMESLSDWALHNREPMEESMFNNNKNREKELKLFLQRVENNEEYKNIVDIDLLNEDIAYVIQRLNKYPGLVFSPHENYLRKNYELRQLLENLKYAAEKGQTKMRYPTPETAAKIEKYKKRSTITPGQELLLQELIDLRMINDNISGLIVKLQKPPIATKLEYNFKYDYKTGATDVFINKDGSLSRVNPGEGIDYRDIVNDHELQEKVKLMDKVTTPKEEEEYLKKFNDLHKKRINNNDKIYDLNDIITYTGNEEYIPEHQTILKKYSDFPKMFKKLYKNQEVRIVTDPQGNTWYEVDVPKDYLNLEWLYKCGGKVKKKLIKRRK